MAKITVLDHHVVYDNPIPNLVSRHGYFPGLVRLASGELLGLFCMGEAFESALTVNVTRSKDNGKSWQLQGPLYDDSADDQEPDSADDDDDDDDNGGCCSFP